MVSAEEQQQQDPSSFPHLVIPGQIIAVSTAAAEDSFLRGHGTYLQKEDNDDRIQLRASVTGTVVRVNRLLSVEPVALHAYAGQVGDLVVGRIASIGNARWNVDLLNGGGGVAAALPLSGVHLPGGVQRVRTAADALEMRRHLQEGDLVSAEAHKVVADNNSILLHTRSVRYGKLENGCVVRVPAKLVPRRKTHYTTICEHRFQILLGCNGVIWMQRNVSSGSSGSSNDAASSSAMMQSLSAGQHELAEAEEKRRAEHAATPYSVEDRRDLARLRCAVACLRQTLCEITPEAVEEVYRASLALRDPKTEKLVRIPDMLLPENVIALTAGRRPP